MKEKDNQPECQNKGFCLTRREFLQGGGATAVTLMLASLPGFVQAKEKMALRIVGYPRKKVGQLSALKQDNPVKFQYPHKHPNCDSFLVKLGQEASGGIGPDRDIVAFNSLCTHMGGSLSGLYKANYKAIGPCPVHLSLFDLSRHGMVVSGHATESLPQIVLEIEGDDIYATGVMGLIYGFADNKVKPAKETDYGD